MTRSWLCEKISKIISIYSDRSRRRGGSKDTNEIGDERRDITTDPTESERLEGSIENTVWELGVLVATGLVIISLPNFSDL